MNAIISFFLKRHFLVHVMVMLVVVVGVQTAMTSQREGFPAVTLNKLVVTARLPGASVAQVESELSSALEEAIDGLDGVDSYQSRISQHVSVTTVDLDDELDPDGVRQVQNDMRQAIDAITDFPAGMEDRPSISRVEAGKFPILEVALSGPDRELAVAAQDLEHELERLEGVAQVEVVGLQDRELRVQVEPELARSMGITLTDVVQKVRARNRTATGGVLERAVDRKQVIADMRYDDPEQIRGTILRANSRGGTVRIGDIAHLELGREDQGLTVHTSQQRGLSLVVRKKLDADILDTVDRIKARLETTRLPKGVEYVLVNDASFLTRNRLQLMLNNGLVGLALVVLVLFIFLSPRAAVWVAAGVPTVMLGVVILLPSVGLTINMITLAGFVIVLGMLVDDAVVVAERIVVMQGRPGADHPALRGVQSVMRPVVASAITTILAFSPMMSLGGMPGKFAWALPVVVLLALIVSLLESFFVLPVHMSRREDEHRSETSLSPLPPPIARKSWIMQIMEQVYRGLLRVAIKLRYLVFLIFVALFIFTMTVIRPLMGVELFPQDDSDALFIKVNMPIGTSLGQTEAAVAAIEGQLPTILGEDLLAITARIGHQDPQAIDRITGSAPHEAVVSAMFKPLGRVHTSAEWAEILHEGLGRPRGATLVFEAKRIGPPVGSPVTIHVAANDDELRRHGAYQVAAYLEKVEGVVDIEIDERPGLRQLELAPNYEKLERTGLSPTALAQFLQTAYHGVKATEIRGLDEDINVRVLLESNARGGLEALLDMPLRAQGGQMVNLRDVVEPVEVDAVSELHHRQGLRCATVTASLAPGSGHTAESMARLLEAELLPALDQPGRDVYLGGEAVESRKTTKDMGKAGFLALLGILTVIAVILNSFLEAAFVIVVIPFGLTGVMWAFFLHDKSLSMFALLGSIGLSGVVVNAAIVMVDAVKQRMAEVGPGSAERRAAMIEAVVERLRPIVVTTLTTVGGVMPTAYGLGGYDAVLSPMSLALGWGLIFATTITLFLVPCLQAIAQDLQRMLPRSNSKHN